MLIALGLVTIIVLLCCLVAFSGYESDLREAKLKAENLNTDKQELGKDLREAVASSKKNYESMTASAHELAKCKEKCESLKQDLMTSVSLRDKPMLTSEEDSQKYADLGAVIQLIKELASNSDLDTAINELDSETHLSIETLSRYATREQLVWLLPALMRAKDNTIKSHSVEIDRLVKELKRQIGSVDNSKTNIAKHVESFVSIFHDRKHLDEDLSLALAESDLSVSEVITYASKEDSREIIQRIDNRYDEELSRLTRENDNLTELLIQKDRSIKGLDKSIELLRSELKGSETTRKNLAKVIEERCKKEDELFERINNQKNSLIERDKRVAELVSKTDELEKLLEEATKPESSSDPKAKAWDSPDDYKQHNLKLMGENVLNAVEEDDKPLRSALSHHANSRDAKEFLGSLPLELAYRILYASYFRILDMRKARKQKQAEA